MNETIIMSASIECQICYTDRNNFIECSKCDNKWCTDCQINSKDCVCLYCKEIINNKILRSQIGNDFVKNIVIAKEIDTLMKTEELIMKTYDPIIKWYELYEKNRKLMMIGKSINLPTKPKITLILGLSSACPLLDCTGYLNINGYNFKCNVCNKIFCNECRELKESEHKCDQSILESINDIIKNTKMCPRCKSRIFKTHGCNHMHCAICDVHFSWITGDIYNSKMYNVNKTLKLWNGSKSTDEIIEPNAMHAIPQDIIVDFVKSYEHFPNEIFLKVFINILYDHYDYLIHITMHDYDTNLIKNECEKSLDKSRISYLSGKISKGRFGTKIYSIYNKQKYQKCVKHIFINHIEFLRSIQSTFNKSIKKIIDKSDIAERSRINDKCEEILNNVNDQFNYNNESLRDLFDNFDIVDQNRFYFKDINYLSNFDENPKEPIISLISEDSNEKKYNEKYNENIEKLNENENEKKIELFDYQKEHYDRIILSLNNNKFAIDISSLGTGKTYISCKIIESNKYKYVVIIVPPILKFKWNNVLNEYSLNADVFSYLDIAGKSNVALKNPFLRKIEFITLNNTGDRTITKEYRPTKLFKKMCDEGILVILDEFQNLKNNSSTYNQSVRSLINELMDMKYSKSGAIFISGTPFDKIEQISSFFKMINIQTKDRLFTMNPQTGVVMRSGYAQIINYVKLLDTYKLFDKEIKAADDFNHNQYASNGKFYNVLILSLFNTVIKFYCSSKMVKHDDIFKLIIYNSFYNIDCDNLELYNDSIQSLTILMNDDGLNIGKKKIAIQRCLMNVEMSKLMVFANVIINALDDNEHSKIVVCLNYTEMIDRMAIMLGIFNPKVLNGKVLTKNRNAIISKFQENNNDVRLLICNLLCISTGIDLDDKFGTHPRYVFVSPNYLSMELHQMNYRFLRLDSQSDTVIKFIYGKSVLLHSDDNVEQRIINSLKVKMNVINTISSINSLMVTNEYLSIF